jgi:hypothetical protein
MGYEDVFGSIRNVGEGAGQTLVGNQVGHHGTTRERSNTVLETVHATGGGDGSDGDGSDGLPGEPWPGPPEPPYPDGGPR